MRKVTLKGVNTILITPFNHDESVDVDGVQRVVDSAVDAGVDGVVALAIMGEASKLTDAERDVLTEAVVAAVGKRVPVVVGCTADATAVAADRVERACRLGADAVMVAPPRGCGPDRVAPHYRTVAAAGDVPVVLQDEPVTTGVSLPASLVARCLEDGKVPYVKVEEVPSAAKVGAILAAAPDATCFGGLGGLYFYEELRHGAAGTMTGFGFPHLLVETYRRYMAGDSEGARDYFYRHLPLIRLEAQLGVGGVAIRKQLIADRGLIKCPAAREPAGGIDAGTVDDLRDLIRYLKL